jgi:hypothetical protein
MVRQVIDVDGYWEVVVYYDVDYGLFGVVAGELRRLGLPEARLEELYRKMRGGRAKAVRFSNEARRGSVVLFNRHRTREDYINSIVHEAEHVKQAMLRGYAVADEGEAPAYTVGYLVGRMWRVFRGMVCGG